LFFYFHFVFLEFSTTAAGALLARTLQPLIIIDDVGICPDATAAERVVTATSGVTGQLDLESFFTRRLVFALALGVLHVLDSGSSLVPYNYSLSSFFF
jgi:hypothetical protein